MSQENVEVARRCFEAWSSWVFEDIAACDAADAEIVSPSSEMFGRTYNGREGLRLYIDYFVAAFEPPEFELEEILDAGERVITVAVCRTRGRDSGVPASAADRHGRHDPRRTDPAGGDLSGSCRCPRSRGAAGVVRSSVLLLEKALGAGLAVAPVQAAVKHRC